MRIGLIEISDHPAGFVVTFDSIGLSRIESMTSPTL
jgi:hypothetical protein